MHVVIPSKIERAFFEMAKKGNRTSKAGKKIELEVGNRGKREGGWEGGTGEGEGRGREERTSNL